MALDTLASSRWRLIFLLGVLATVLYFNAHIILKHLPISLTSKVLSLWHAEGNESSFITGFDRLAMPGASEEQLDQALAWKSIFSSEESPEESPDGRGDTILSLNPAKAGDAPIIWNVTRNQFTQVTWKDSSGKYMAHVTSLGAFDGGLSPACVEGNDTASQGKTELKCGYVDTTGHWVIPPAYANAGTFAGGVAVVRRTDQSIRLINRKGHELPWEIGNPQFIPQGSGIQGIKLVRLGKWTWINQAAYNANMPDGSGPGTSTYLSDGFSLFPLAGDDPKPSLDGELWLFQTPDGAKLWKPSTGFVNLPKDIVPLAPVNANLFTANSRTSQSSALYSIDGRLIADPAPIVKALTSKRFLACQDAYSPSTFDWEDLARNLGPDVPNQHCGIMDEKGQWWAKPVYQMIELWGAHEVRLQSGDIACMAKLDDAAPPDCATGKHAPVPRLVMDQFPRIYTYQNWGRRQNGTFHYDLAYPYIGQVAQVAYAGGFPGLIDLAGRMLTPRPGGAPLVEAHVLAATLQYTNQSGQAWRGLIDHSGKRVIPPVFGDITFYPDGTLNACDGSLGIPATKICHHLDSSGNLLPPSSEQAVSSLNSKPKGDSAANSPAAADSPKPPQAQAVALNGRWGFQNSQGKWVIQPSFDDAFDFANDRALVALAQVTQTPDGNTVSKLWGIIDAFGNWVVKPRFEDALPLANGGAIVKENGVFGMIDRDGAWLAKPEFQSIGEFTNGFAVAIKADGSNCILAANGVCNGNFSEVRQVGEDYAVAGQRGRNYEILYGYIKKDGSWAIPPSFSQADPFVGNVAVASGKLPELPMALRKQWVTVEVQHFIGARMYAVKLLHPGESAKAGRFALVDDKGNYLVPTRGFAGGAE